MLKDPLEKHEIKADLPPRQRLQTAGEALKSPTSQRRWPWLIVGLMIIIIILLWLK